MLSTHQLRDALRKGLFLQLQREKPTVDNRVALRLARMREKQAWKRRDEETVDRLLRILTQEILDKLENRFQGYFLTMYQPPPPENSPEAKVQ